MALTGAGGPEPPGASNTIRPNEPQHARGILLAVEPEQTAKGKSVTTVIIEMDEKKLLLLSAWNKIDIAVSYQTKTHLFYSFYFRVFYYRHY